jgi:hypothetical protein
MVAQAEPVHGEGVGDEAIVAGAKVESVTGPVVARLMRHGIVRSARVPA